jgi:hypothetical protein
MSLTEAKKQKIKEEEKYRAQIASASSPKVSKKHGVPALPVM